MYLEELTGSITLENLEVECKARLDRNNPQSWIKTVGGFSNAAGGTFYIGAEDKTFKLIGFTRKDADNERNYFNNQINEHVSPRPQYTISFLRYEVNQKDLFILRQGIFSFVSIPAEGKEILELFRAIIHICRKHIILNRFAAAAHFNNLFVCRAVGKPLPTHIN